MRTITEVDVVGQASGSLSEPKDSDNALVRAFLEEGDESAFTQLDTRYRVGLLRFVSRNIRDHTQAEDLVQETFMRVARHLHNFDQKKSRFSSWILTIASNLCKNELRGRRCNPIALSSGAREDWQRDATLEFRDRGPWPDEILLKKEERKMVQASMKELHEKDRQILVLRFGGATQQEIASTLSIPLGTAKSGSHRAFTRLKEVIRKKLG